MRPTLRSLTILCGLALATGAIAAEDRHLVMLSAGEASGPSFNAEGLMLVAELPGGYLAFLTPGDIGRLEGWGVSHRVLAADQPDRYDYVVQYDVDHGDRATALPGAAEVLYEGDGLKVLRLPAGDDLALSCLPDVQRVFRRPLRFVNRPWQEPALSRTVEPDIQAIVAGVDQMQLQSLVQTLQNFGTRHSQYAGGAQAANWIRDQFLAYGYTDVILHDYNAWNDNVVCTKPGAVQPDKLVVIGGHYDSITSTPANAPGADDNATGTACVLAAAQLMADLDFEYTLVFIAFSGEEQGLYGSEAWADEAAAAGLDIVGMINLDMLAYRAAGDAADADLVANAASAPLRDLAYECLATYVPGFTAVNGSLPFGASSDHASFWNAGFRALMLFEDTGSYSPYIHTTSDVVGTSANDFAFMTSNVKLALATTAALARPFHVAIVHDPLAHQGGTGPFPLTAEIIAAGALDLPSLRLYYRVDGGAFVSVPLAATGAPDTFGATIPAQSSGALIEYYLAAGDESGFTTTSPVGAPGTLHAFRTGIEHVFVDDAETDQGWTFGAAGDNATSGLWLRADPVATDYQPEDDHTLAPGHICFVTGNGAPGGGNGDQDVDGGRTTLISPVFDVLGANWAEVSYWRWYVDATTMDDDFLVDISDDGGATWTSLEVVPDSAYPWVHAAFTLPRPGVEMTDQMRLRFIATDTGGGSLVEALIDDLAVVAARGDDLTSVPAALAAASLSAAPNPFNPRTTLQFTLPRGGETTLRVLDARGRETAHLDLGARPAGAGEIVWDATGVASGIYFAELVVDGASVTTAKLTLVR